MCSVDRCGRDRSGPWSCGDVALTRPGPPALCGALRAVSASGVRSIARALQTNADAPRCNHRATLCRVAGLTIPPPASSKPGKDDVKIEISKPFKGHKLDPPPAYAYTNPTELLQLYKVRIAMRHARCLFVCLFVSFSS